MEDAYVTNCYKCGRSLMYEEVRSPDPEVFGAELAKKDFCIVCYANAGYFDELEFTVKMRVEPNNRGRKYQRAELLIQLPEALKDWRLVPAFLYGHDVWIHDDVLNVKIRKLK